MKRMMRLSVLLLGLACVANGQDNTNINPLIDSVPRIATSVVPILHKVPSEKNTYRLDNIIATGFFIHEDGLIATASHVTETPELQTSFKNKVFPCSVVLSELVVNSDANDPNHGKEHVWDVAVLKIECADGPFPPARLSGKTEFRPGEPAAIYGYYEKGQSYTVAEKTHGSALLTSGIVSAIFSISCGEMKLGSRLVLDITAGPGSSGSPAFDPESGEVIGIVSQGKLKSVLSPEPKTDKIVVTRVPMGITDTEPVIQLRKWLREGAPRLGYE